MNLARWESVGIGTLVGAVGLLRHRLPAKVELGEAVLLAAALLLLQGLARDVARLLTMRARVEGEAPRVTCVCAESTLGVSAIVGGIFLVFGTSPLVLPVPSLGWPMAVGVVALFGFATRHLVFDWRARRLRWEPDHAGVVVWRAR